MLDYRYSKIKTAVSDDQRNRFIPFSASRIFYSVRAQDSQAKYLEAGIEVQQYPTVFLLGIRSAVSMSTHQALELRQGAILLWGITYRL